MKRKRRGRKARVDENDGEMEVKRRKVVKQLVAGEVVVEGTIFWLFYGVLIGRVECAGDSQAA